MGELLEIPLKQFLGEIGDTSLTNFWRKVIRERISDREFLEKLLNTLKEFVEKSLVVFNEEYLQKKTPEDTSGAVSEEFHVVLKDYL